MRAERQARFDVGELPGCLPETHSIRESNWKVAEIPVALNDRRVEITGSVERKMFINALNSSAKVFMADFEDSTAPTWANLVDGQINLRDAVTGSIALRTVEGRDYRLNPDPAVWMMKSCTPCAGVVWA